MKERREGIELAIRIGSSSTWIPLQVHYFNIHPPNEVAGTEVIRGHRAEVVGTMSSTEVKEAFICGDLLRGDSIQFRWMGSAYIDITEGEFSTKHDVWALSNITASLVTDNRNTTLFEDMFGSETLKYVCTN